MSVLKIISEALYIIFGVGIIIAVFALEMPVYWALVGAGLAAWGVYDIYKEVRDLNSKGEVGQLAKEREEILKKLNEEK